MNVNAAMAHQKLYHFAGLPNPVAPAGTGQLSTKSVNDQYEADAAYWYGTLAHEEVNSTFDLLHRVWAIIWHGGLWMKEHGGTWKSWHDADIPIAACLSHGGRVLVQLPRASGDPDRIWHWLWGDHEPETRQAATHGVELGKFEDMPDGRPKCVREIKGKGGGGKHFGVNFSGGGFGFINPISGNPIVGDGRHGHLYICYVAPTAETRGAIMFGAEDTAPIDRATKTLGQTIGIGVSVGLLPLTLIEILVGEGRKFQPVSPWLKGAFPKGQTGAYHAFGVSGKYSLTGGEKFSTLAEIQPTLSVPAGNDSLFVNPPAALWERLITGDLSFKVQWLGYSPDPPPLNLPSETAMPSQKEFAAATYVSPLHVRNKWLKEMDKCLNAYKGSPGGVGRHPLTDFIGFGKKYLGDHKGEPDKVIAKVKEYIKTAMFLTGNLH